MLRLLRGHLVCGLLALLALAPSHALDPARGITQYIQSTWNSNSGLPENGVHAIAQTQDGYLWFGTEEGLVRFDGVRFQVFTREDNPGLASDYISALESGSAGDLWIGTDSGLTHYTPSPQAPTRGLFQSTTVKEGLAGDQVAALCRDRDGALWVGTNLGLSRIHDGRVEDWSRGRGLPFGAVNALALDRQGTLWVGLSKGLAWLDHGRFLLISARDGLPQGRVQALAAAPDGSVWAGTALSGLFQVRQGRATVFALPLPWKEVNALRVDRQGALWVGFDRHGIGRVAGGRVEIYDASRGLPSNRCTSALFEDRDGGLWIGFLDSGVLQLRDGQFVVFGKPEGLSGNFVANILQGPDGSMWIGVDSNGVNRLLPDGSVEVWDHRRGLPNQTAYPLALGHDGSIWVGYRNGELARIRNGRVSVFRDPAALNLILSAIFEDRQGTVWVGFYGGGAARFDNGVFHHISGAERVSQFAQSADGALWIATVDHGVERYAAGSLTRFTTADGLPSNHAMGIMANADGVWVGSASGGLSLIAGGHIESWTAREGLPVSTVGSIADDGLGNLWGGSDAGIFRLSRQELLQTGGHPGAQIHAVLYGTADGLRSRETFYGSMPGVWRDRDGRIWFPTIGGAAVVDPRRVTANPPPPVLIEQMVYDGSPVPLLDGSRLQPGAGNVQFSFTAPSFVAPQLIQFRYRLAGFDRDWVEAGDRRTAWYTNLPPGRYTFEVQAAPSGGVWSSAGASLGFTLRPPFYRTPVAYIAYVLLLMGLLWFAGSFRTRRLRRSQHELNRIVTERTAQLQAEKTALEEARNQLQILATHDSLTGLYNRGAMLEHLEREMARARRDQTTLGVIIADLDHFKLVNDRHGHLCGDEVLREIAERLRGAMRGYDVAGRFGGEEFLILFPDFDLHQSPGRVQELLDAVGSLPFLTAAGAISVTCSIGVGTFRPAIDDPDPLAVIRRADRALYAAKEAGRACARFEERAEAAVSGPRQGS